MELAWMLFGPAAWMVVGGALLLVAQRARARRNALRAAAEEWDPY